MTEETIQTQLRSAVERTKTNWFAIATAIMAARDRKIQEQLAAIISHYSLAELETAHKLVDAEISKLVSNTLSTTLPAAVPAVASANKPTKPARKPKS